jgi:uncharacterized protein (TIGR00369 family)
MWCGGVWIRWAAHCNHVLTPTSWLYRVTSNVAVDHIRQVVRRCELPGTDMNSHAGHDPEPHRMIEIHETVCDGVRILLESLSPLERAVFVFRRIGRRSHAETAEALGRSPAAVRQLDHRAGVHLAKNSQRFVAGTSIVQHVADQLLLAASMGELETMVNIMAPGVPTNSSGDERLGGGMGHDEELRRSGQDALDAQPFSKLLGARLELLEPGQAVLQVSIRPEHLQQLGFVHGGMLAYAADNALTFAGGSVLGPKVVTSEFKISFVRPAIGRSIVARARSISRGQRQAVCSCNIHVVDGSGAEALCAVALGTIVVAPSRPSGDTQTTPR